MARAFLFVLDSFASAALQMLMRMVTMGRIRLAISPNGVPGAVATKRDCDQARSRCRI